MKHYYKTQEHSWPRKHVANLRGKKVVFQSVFRVGTYSLHGDAIQVLKDAGVYERTSDADKILIDGRPHRPTH